MIDKKYYTAKEIAKSLSVKPVTIYRLAKRGELNAIRIGKSIRFDPEEVDTFIKNASIKKAEKKHFSIVGIVCDGRVTDEDIDEVINEWNKTESR